MKLIVILFCFLLFITMLVGCNNLHKKDEISTSSAIELTPEQKEQKSKTDKEVAFLKSDIETPKEKLISRGYSLNEFITFFEGYYENPHAFTTSNGKILSIHDVHKKFPIECFRYNYNLGHRYVIYKINEGGFFYVFFQPSVSGELSISKVNYFSNTNAVTIEDFNDLHFGKSTALDVYKIDPGMVLYELGNFPESYTLTKKGVVRITYKYKEVSSPDRLDRYIVDSIEYDEIKYALIFNQILKIDMP